MCKQLCTGQVTLQDKFVLEYGSVDYLVLTGQDLDSAYYVDDSVFCL